LFGLHDKHISFGIKPSHILMKLGIHVQNISEFTFDLLDCFKHFQISNYLHVTLHLTWSLTNGEDSKVDKMSYNHPNLNLVGVIDSRSQDEPMGKNSFLDFEFDQL
jgi:hypothetical protein